MKWCGIVFMITMIAVLVYGCSSENGPEEESKADILTEEADRTDHIGKSEVLLSDVWSEDEMDRIKRSSQQKQAFDAKLYEYKVILEEIPELSYCSVSQLNTGDNYICYRDILILGNTIYRREEEKYVRQDTTLNAVFGIEDELEAVDCRQCENLIAAVSEDDTSFYIYDMDTWSQYCCYRVDKDMKIGPFWYIYNRSIYYSEWDKKYQKERTLIKISLLDGAKEEIYRPANGRWEECIFGAFAIRDDGTLLYEIYNKAERCMEYWIAKKDGNGEWGEKKIWENKSWEFDYVLSFNQYGLVMLGTSNISSDNEIIVIRDNGEIGRLDENIIYGRYLFTGNGYFSSNLAKLEHMPWDDDSVELEWKTRYLADSISFYNYEGEMIYNYPMIDKKLLEQGYYLKKLIWHDGNLTGFYVQSDTDELYIT